MPIFSLGAGDPDGSDEEVHLVLLHREHVFDAGADLGLESVGARACVSGIGLTRRLLAMDAADEAVPSGTPRSASSGRPCRPSTALAVLSVEQPLAQPRALVGRGVGRVPAPDQPMLAIDRDMVLVAEGRDGDVDPEDRAVGPRPWPWLNLTVQRASRSLCRSLAGSPCQASGMRPSLIAFFSAAVLRCFGAAISEASTIWPPMAR